MGTLITSELAVSLFTVLGLAITAIAIVRDLGTRRAGDGPVMTLEAPARTLAA